MKRNASRLLKVLSVVWKDVYDNIAWILGNGREVDFWYDWWVPPIGPLVIHVAIVTGSSMLNVSVANMVEDANHVLQNCVQAQMIWREMIRLDNLEEFFTLDFKRWIRENLTNGDGFSKENANRT
ncbi:hypothetical protein V6N13_060999 [Hibiscus sabdariffa]